MTVEDIYDREVDLVPRELELLIYPDPLLHCESIPITRFDDEENQHLTQLLADMTLTMVKNNGIGISAPQVGYLARMLVILAQQPDKEHPEPFALINPTILEADGEYEWEEGCLSVPGYYENRIRPKRIVVKFHNLSGEEKEMEFHGIYAFTIQHEIDHLDGKLFIDELSTFKKKFSVEKKIKKFMKSK